MLDKGLVEFIDQQPIWVREAFARAAGGALRDEDVEVLEGILLGKSSAQTSHEEPEPDDGPDGDEPARGRLELRRIKVKANVNRLKDGQSLTFSPGPGLTLVFGINGSGKSGFARVLKAAAGTPGASPVRGNVYGNDQEQPSAQIWATEDGTERNYTWNGEPLDALSQVFVFDREGTNGWLLRDHTIQITPGGLDRLEHVVDAAKQLRARLGSLQEGVRDPVAELAALPQRECVQQRLAGLGRSVTSEEIRDLIVLSQQEREELANLRDRTASPEDRSRHARLLRQVASSQQSVADDAKAALQALQRTQNELPQVREEALELEASLSALDSSEADLELLTSEDWQRLWKAALALSGDAVPAEVGEPCPLCRRQVTEEVHTHWGSLSVMLRSDLLRRREGAADRIRRLKQELASIELSTSEEQRHALSETDGRGPLQSGLHALRQAVAAAQSGHAAYVVPWELADLLKHASEQLEAKATSLEKPLAEHEEKELADLEALAQLSGLQEACEREVVRLDKLHQLDEALAKIQPKTLSSAVTAHGERIVGSRFKEQLDTELKALLDTVQLADVETVGRAGKLTGKPKLTGTDGKTNLRDVLSEGEQTSVSLAVFLAETSLMNPEGCLVFDDPVSSMDHFRRERLARRIGKLAQKRQVIVFTHDLVFYSELRKNVPHAALRLVAANRADAGIVSSGKPPVDGKSCDDYFKQLQDNLKAAKSIDEHRPADLPQHVRSTAHDFRPGIETLVADVVTGGVVRRLDVRVRVSDVTDLADLELEALERIRQLWREVSAYDHTSGAEKGPLPCSVALLERWAEEFDELIGLFSHS